MADRRLVVTQEGTDAQKELQADDQGRLLIAGASLKAGTDFDYIDVQQTSASVETYVYKLGGSGGTSVLTIVVTYTDSEKTDIDSVSYA